MAALITDEHSHSASSSVFCNMSEQQSWADRQLHLVSYSECNILPPPDRGTVKDKVLDAL